MSHINLATSYLSFTLPEGTHVSGINGLSNIISGYRLSTLSGDVVSEIIYPRTRLEYDTMYFNRDEKNQIKMFKCEIGHTGSDIRHDYFNRNGQVVHLCKTHYGLTIIKKPNKKHSHTRHQWFKCKKVITNCNKYKKALYNSVDTYLYPDINGIVQGYLKLPKGV